MSSREADSELYYQLMDRTEEKERAAWLEALEPVRNLELELLEGLPEKQAYLYSNIVSALSEIATARRVLVEDHAFDSGRSVEDLPKLAGGVQSYLSRVKAEAAHLSSFLAENRLGSAGKSPLELFA